MFEQILTLLENEPVYLSGLAVVAVVFGVGLIKKAIKIMVVALLLGAGYAYYLHETAVDYYETAQERMEDVQDRMEDAKDRIDDAKAAAEDAGDQARDLVDSAKDLIKKLD